MRRQRPFATLAIALILAGCGAGDEPEPTGLTPSEAEQLNAAAAELDNQAGVDTPAATQDPAS